MYIHWKTWTLPYNNPITTAIKSSRPPVNSPVQTVMGLEDRLLEDHISSRKEVQQKDKSVGEKN